MVVADILYNVVVIYYIEACAYLHFIYIATSFDDYVAFYIIIM